MPRLGEDPSIATAYPNRHPLSRRGLLRQLFTTALGSLLLFFIFNKVYLTNYREKTRDSMLKNGMDEKTVERLVPKTKTEVTFQMKEMENDKLKRIATLENNVGNLTLSVQELQQAFEKTTGVTLKHMVNATTLLGEGVADGAPPVVDAGGNSDHRRRQLRG